MIALRAAKAATVAAIALFASLVTFGNLTDYNTNYVFVEHVLSMDTIYAFSTIKYRAITDPALAQAAYALIIATDAAKTSRPRWHHRIAPMHIAHGSPEV
jgi:predicted small integral membrane protein